MMFTPLNLIISLFAYMSHLVHDNNISGRTNARSMKLIINTTSSYEMAVFIRETDNLCG